MALGFSEGKMAEASVASNHCPRADGDVARCPHLRSSFAMEDRRQRHRPTLFLRHRFRIDRVAARCANRRGGLERHQERETGVENWVVSHDAESRRPMLFAVNLGLRVQTFRAATTVPTVSLALSAIGTGLLIGSAYLGGMMVYTYGISVARLSKKKWRKIAEAGRANLPPEPGK